MKEESLNLEPNYSTNEIPGKCLKCLGEKELNVCLSELLRGEGEDPVTVKRYETIAAFLKSPVLKDLCDVSEKLMSEGKKVSLKFYPGSGSEKTRYELIIEES